MGCGGNNGGFIIVVLVSRGSGRCFLFALKAIDELGGSSGVRITGTGVKFSRMEGLRKVDDEFAKVLREVYKGG